MEQMDKFQKDIYQGKVKLYDPEIMTSIMPDIKVEYSEEDADLSRAIDVFLSINLSEKDYLMYQLRKRKHTLDQIGDCFGVKKSAVCERLKRIEKKVEALLDPVKNYYEIQNKLSELEMRIRNNSK